MKLAFLLAASSIITAAPTPIPMHSYTMNYESLYGDVTFKVEAVDWWGAVDEGATQCFKYYDDPKHIKKLGEAQSVNLADVCFSPRPDSKVIEKSKNKR